MAWVYILKSQVNGRYYIGSTEDLKQRIIDHNNGKSKYTRLTRPFAVVFNQEFSNIKIARQIETRLKKYKSRIIIEKIIHDGYIKRDKVG